jgi:hypothetical protein
MRTVSPQQTPKAAVLSNPQNSNSNIYLISNPEMVPSFSQRRNFSARTPYALQRIWRLFGLLDPPNERIFWVGKRV